MGEPRVRTPDDPSLLPWPEGVELWRVARDPDGLAFSASPTRSNRFSPLGGPGGSVIPSWYGATSPKGAIFESVFHDVRQDDPSPRVFPVAYVSRVLAPVHTVRSLLLVDLTSSGLHAIGISRQDLIESRPSRYRWTREVGARLYATMPGSDGFVWVSRADDTSLSVVLFAGEGRPPMLGADPTREPLALGAGRGLALVRELATAARITLVVPDRT